MLFPKMEVIGAKSSIFTIYIFIVMLFFSQTMEGEELFNVEAEKLYMEKYKWGWELYLDIMGNAQTVLNNVTLTLSIQYADKTVKSRQIILTSSPISHTIPFMLHWGPLNQPYEHVLAGSYLIKLELSIGNQNPSERDRLKSILKDKEYVSWEKKLEWGNADIYKEEDVKIKEYYIQLIKKVDQICLGLIKESSIAINVPKAIRNGQNNPYIDPVTKKFAPEKWRKWLDEQFEECLQKENNEFLKSCKKLFASRYPKAQAGLEEYFSVLLRLGRISSMAVHTANQIKMDARDTTRVDTFGIENLNALRAYLNTLLIKTCEELGEDYIRILGRKIGK